MRATYTTRPNTTLQPPARQGGANVKSRFAQLAAER
jgi:hypothetical protein